MSLEGRIALLTGGGRGIGRVISLALTEDGADVAINHRREALAFTLTKEEERHGIRVNVVAPGVVETEMGRQLMKGAAGIDDLRTLDRHSPFGRVCQPEDVANVVRFLVSDAASYVSGQRIYVAGARASSPLS